MAAPTITSSLDGRYMSALKPERVVAAKVYAKLGVNQPTAIPGIDKAQLIDDVRKVRSGTGGSLTGGSGTGGSGRSGRSGTGGSRVCLGDREGSPA